MIRLDADQILYIESRGHTIIYHTEIGEYAERGSLKSAEEKLAQRHYYKCNNCYLVNLAHVERVNQLVVTVKGQALQLAVHGRKALWKPLLHIWEANNRRDTGYSEIVYCAGGVVGMCAVCKAAAPAL